MAKEIETEMTSLNKALHESNKEFGNRPEDSALSEFLPKAIRLLHKIGICNSILDYGAGKGTLISRLTKELPMDIKLLGYDPAIHKFDKKPREKVDLLLCLDVLEHIDISVIDEVINDIHSLCTYLSYIVIDLQPAVKVLPDGRNTHILLAPPEWWVSKFAHHFPVVISFPIKHLKGFDQKLVLGLAKKSIHIPALYQFLYKLDIFNMRMLAGPGGNLK